jgi:hypothetical protein
LTQNASLSIEEKQQVMRNFTSDSEDKGQDLTLGDGTSWAARIPDDFTSVLLKLARAQHGFLF